MASATPRPLLVVGPGAVAARRASSTVGDEPSAAVRREPAGSSREPWPGSPPQVDVEGLTEQVVRRIDERIVAFRERMGKPF